MHRDVRFQLLAVILLGAIGGYVAATSGGASPALRDSTASPGVSDLEADKSVSSTSAADDTPECCRLEGKLGLGARMKAAAKTPPPESQ